MKHLLFLHHADTFEQTLTYFYICSVKFIFCPILFAVFFCFFFISVWHHLFSILQIPAIKQERNEYLGFMMTYFRFFDVFHFKMIDVLSVKNYVRPDNHDTAWQVSYRPMNTTRPAAMTVMDPPCSLRSGPTGLWTMESTWSCTSSSSVHTDRKLRWGQDESAFRQEAALLTTWSATLCRPPTGHINNRVTALD